MPSRKRYLLVCTNSRDKDDPKGSCAQAGSEDVMKRMKKLIKKSDAAMEIRACSTSCLDLCEIGAAVVQEPEHVAYGRVTVDDVDELVECAIKGKVLERLVVHR